MSNLSSVLVRTLITEKTSIQTDKYNRYGFIVDLKCNKNQIKQAVEYFYGVKVLNVKTSITPGKTKRTSKSFKKTSSKKKALVQLASGQKIEFFKGV